MTRKRGTTKPSQSGLSIIGGQYRGRKIPVLDAPGLRPTGNRVRETLFNWLQPFVVDAKVADLFCGAGGLCFEAASRGAAKVTALDTNTKAIAQLKKIASDFGATNIEFAAQDALQWLGTYTDPLDLVFLDPPFNADLLEQALALLDQHPAIHTDTLIYIEAPKAQTLTLPPQWQWWRHKTAGDTQFGLAAPIN